MPNIEIPAEKLMKTDWFKASEDNPNKMTESQMAALKSSIEQFGFIVPVIASPDGGVIDGAHRLEAAKSLGMPEIPAIIVSASSVDERIIRQVMNKLRGRHDMAADLLEFERINDAGKLGELAMLIDEDKETLESLLGKAEPDSEPLPETDLTEGMELGQKCPKCGYEF